MLDLRADAHRVLVQNFPNSPFLKGRSPTSTARWWEMWNW
jgi:hypothetical protein